MTKYSLKELSFLHPIIMYDGPCIFCNACVNVLFKLDKKHRIKCCTLQYAESRDTDIAGNKSVILLWKGEYYYKSEAIIRALQFTETGGVILSKVISIFPTSFRDWIYDVIAKSRYTLFGKNETCSMPDPSWRGRIIG